MINKWHRTHNGCRHYQLTHYLATVFCNGIYVDNNVSGGREGEVGGV